MDDMNPNIDNLMIFFRGNAISIAVCHSLDYILIDIFCSLNFPISLFSLYGLSRVLMIDKTF